MNQLLKQIKGEGAGYISPEIFPSIISIQDSILADSDSSASGSMESLEEEQLFQD